MTPTFKDFARDLESDLSRVTHHGQLVIGLTEIALVALRRAMYAEQKNRTASELMRMVVALAENPWQTPFDLDDVAEECERWLVSRAPSA